MCKNLLVDFCHQRSSGLDRHCLEAAGEVCLPLLIAACHIYIRSARNSEIRVMSVRMVVETCFPTTGASAAAELWHERVGILGAVGEDEDSSTAWERGSSRKLGRIGTCREDERDL
jgi:hypothetical protein